jgi:unsaturated rhamnogalacturonyl hydrolase
LRRCSLVALRAIISGWLLCSAAFSQSAPRVTVDAWFNSQQRLNAAGQQEYFHYKWEDASNSGFFLLGQVFRGFGAVTDTLYTAPTVANLKGTQIYLIVSPDIPAKNPHPHYLQTDDAQQVAEWVRSGGVLVLMGNDPANGELEHFDQLADLFGIHFNRVLSHHVPGKDQEPGRIPVKGGGPVFHYPHLFYMKDTCTLSLTAAASAILEDRGDILMARASYGKGTVFAVADPWIYNEYVNGQNLPPEYDNLAGAVEMVRWLMGQIPGAPHAKRRSGGEG